MKSRELQIANSKLHDVCRECSIRALFTCIFQCVMSSFQFLVLVCSGLGIRDESFFNKAEGEGHAPSIRVSFTCLFQCVVSSFQLLAEIGCGCGMRVTTFFDEGEGGGYVPSIRVYSHLYFVFSF